MIKASVVAACAALMMLTGPADAGSWKRDGYGWRSADGAGYGWGHRRHRHVGVGYGYRDSWRRRHWRGDGYRYGSGVAVGVHTGDRWDRGRRWRGDGYGWRANRSERRSLFRDWRADRGERRGLFRDRRVEADVVTK